MVASACAFLPADVPNVPSPVRLSCWLRTAKKRKRGGYKSTPPCLASPRLAPPCQSQPSEAQPDCAKPRRGSTRIVPNSFPLSRGAISSAPAKSRRLASADRWGVDVFITHRLPNSPEKRASGAFCPSRRIAKKKRGFPVRLPPWWLLGLVLCFTIISDDGALDVFFH